MKAVNQTVWHYQDLLREKRFKEICLFASVRPDEQLWDEEFIRNRRDRWTDDQNRRASLYRQVSNTLLEASILCGSEMWARLQNEMIDAPKVIRIFTASWEKAVRVALKFGAPLVAESRSRFAPITKRPQELVLATIFPPSLSAADIQQAERNTPAYRHLSWVTDPDNPDRPTRSLSDEKADEVLRDAAFGFLRSRLADEGYELSTLAKWFGSSRKMTSLIPTTTVR